MSDMLKYSHILITAFFVSISAGTSSFAGNNSGAAFSTWPDTGQIKCYDDSQEIPCPSEGQPFHGQDAQHNGPARSYTLLGGGTMVQDNVTGLIWEMKNSMNGVKNYSNPNDADNTYTWCDPNAETNGGDQGTCGDYDTKDFIDQLNSGGGFGGHIDWRMPTIKELATLTDLGRTNPVIDLIFMDSTRSSGYWSATTPMPSFSPTTITTAFDIHFAGSYSQYIVKSGSIYARAVRGGQNPPVNRFVDNGDTVTDTVTCLQWQKATMDTKNGAGPDRYTWQEALAVCEDLNLSGLSDWRLPDRNELLSLINFNGNIPAIDPIFSSTTQWNSGDTSSYWISTTSLSSNGFADRVDFGTGYVHSGVKSAENYVRAVRGEQCGGIGIMGDIDLSGDVTLADTLLALQIASGQLTGITLSLVADVNTDEKIGMAEAIYSLQKVAGLR